MPAPVFGKYEVLKRLAVGGMGEVFLARQTGIPGFERYAILKSLLPDVAEQAGAIDEFLDEARVAANLNHPNVVQIFEVGLWEGTYYIAMEFIDGDNLAGLRKAALACGQAVPFEVVARVIHDAALGLDHAHTAKDMTGRALEIVHRDISPQNIMVRRDGVTKVVDFGIARAANRATRTKTGMTKGKLAYMPPEQVRGQKVDHRSDQYALGVVLWEMLANKRLFVGEHDMDIIKSVLRGVVDPPSKHDPSVPPELEAIAMQMVQPDRNARFATNADAAAALNMYLEQAAPGVGTAEVSRFVTAVFDGMKARTEKPTKPNENFVIDLKGGGAGAQPITGPVDSQRLAAAGGSYTPPAIDTEGATSVKPRVALPEAGVNTPGPIPSGPSSGRSLRAAGVAPGPVPAPAVPAKPGLPKWALPVGGAVLALLVAGGVVVVGNSLKKPPPVDPQPAPNQVATKPTAPAKPVVRAQLTAQPEAGAIRVEGPAGAQVIVDGTPWKDKAPCTVSGLAPGPHRLRLVLDGVEVPEENLSLEAPPPAKLHLETTPAGAQVLLAGKALGATPFDTAELPPGKYELELHREGYSPAHQSITLSRGSTQNVSLQLVPLPRVGKGGHDKGPKQPEPHTPVKPVAAGPTFGFLSLDTKPWTQVEIDGELYGSTPLIKKKLLSGAHKVVMFNDGAGVRTSKTIQIEADQTLKLILPLK